MHIIRPFSSRKSAEIVSAPKVYAFDTGFVCFFKGWHKLRSEDMGLLWEHFVLTEIIARLQTRRIQYWRNKNGHEIDFIYARRGADPAAIECYYSDGTFTPANLKAFRRRYPSGRNYVVVSGLSRSNKRNFDGLKVEVVSLPELVQALSSNP